MRYTATVLLAVLVVSGASLLEVSHEYRVRRAVDKIEAMFDSLYIRQDRIYDCCCGGSQNGEL